MAASAEARAFAEELFEGLGGVTMRPMFGGYAIYCRGQVFALLTRDERIYIKATGSLAAELAAEGSEQFSHHRKDGRVILSGHWSLPDAALDDAEIACDWARRALGELGPP